ncbi:MAG TPA: SDR family oxidoreductase, partial [Hyphomicrobiaceae bacterium]|nr:SDR family oxidoreductase [Hyphomicrobiaceae bacterium]
MGIKGRAAYTSAKGGVASMTRAMAVDHAAQKIRVNAIAPSVTLSDRVKKLMEGNPGVASLGSQHLFGLGQPIHIADIGGNHHGPDLSRGQRRDGVLSAMQAAAVAGPGRLACRGGFSSTLPAARKHAILPARRRTHPASGGMPWPSPRTATRRPIPL